MLCCNSIHNKFLLYYRTRYNRPIGLIYSWANDSRYLSERQPEKEIGGMKNISQEREETNMKRNPVRIQQSSFNRKKLHQRRRFDNDSVEFLYSLFCLSGLGQK